MMRLSVVFLFFFAFYSCEQNAVNYNDSLIKPQIEVSAYLDSIFSPNSSYTDIQVYREKMIESAENGLNQARILKTYKGNSSFRESGQKYYSFVTTYFSSTLEIDSILYRFNSPERLESISTERMDQVKKNFHHFLELENTFLEEQQKFGKEFNVKL